MTRILRTWFNAACAFATALAGAMLVAQHVPMAWGLLALGFGALILEAAA